MIILHIHLLPLFTYKLFLFTSQLSFQFPEFRNNKDADRGRVCANVYSFLLNAAHNNIVQKLDKQMPAAWLLSSSTCLELSINLWKNKLFVILIRTSLQRQHFQKVTIQKANSITMIIPLHYIIGTFAKEKTIIYFSPFRGLCEMPFTGDCH